MNIELLHSERLHYWCNLVDIPSGATAALEKMRSLVVSDGELGAAFQAFYDGCVVNGQWHRDWSPLPCSQDVQEKCDEDASLFYLLGYLSALPRTWDCYQELGVGIDVFKDTMYDFRRFILEYHEATGRWGFFIFSWIWRHVNAQLFRLGRLQYMLTKFDGGIRAFRRRPSSEEDGSNASYVLLGDPNMALRPDGYAWGAGRAPGANIPQENADTWRPVFEQTDQGWHGHVVTPNGWVRRAAVVLPSAEWEIVLQPGDSVLDLHIPNNGEFTSSSCAESYVLATEFQRQVFPNQQYNALFCHTWMFSPQLQRFLPDSSNIVKFQREFYLYPIPGTVEYLWSFVFGGAFMDPKTCRRDTTLRRKVLDCLADQGEVFDLAGVLFHRPSDWGTQPYMSAFDNRAGAWDDH